MSLDGRVTTLIRGGERAAGTADFSDPPLSWRVGMLFHAIGVVGSIMSAVVESTVDGGVVDKRDTKEVVTATGSEDLESDNSKEFLTRKKGSTWTIIGCALANLSDGYQQNLASNTNVIFNHLIGTKIYTSAIQTRISNSLLVGSVIGIVFLGYYADKFSRKGGMVFTSALVIIGSLMSTLAFQVHPVHGMFWFMTVARGTAGVGVGGEYPTSAAAALEGSEESYIGHRGPIQVLISTLMATSGAPLCTFVYLMSLLASNNNLKVAFHAIYTISIFLPIFVVLFRLKMQDGRLFEKSNFKKRRIPWMLVVRRYWLRLLGTSSAFFLYDFINFPNSIMSSVIINSIVPGKAVRTVALWQFYLALMPIPGVFLGAWLVNRIGRRWTGIVGFFMGYVVLGFIIGGCYTQLTENSIAAFVVLYGLLQAFGHMGPGATIGLISAESYPTAVRGIGYGISAGFGKAGAAIGTQAFTPMRANEGPSSTFYLAGAVGILGCVIYYFLPEGMTLDLRKEDEEFEAYLKEQGFTEEVEKN